MKISNNNLIKNYTELRLHTKETPAPSVTPSEKHSFDAVIIQSNPRQIEEHTFAKAVSRQLSSEVSSIASAEKIGLLQKQVSEHMYQVDAHAIASRMLVI
ncbi:MAG: flagellar biosynthesis anti-sigma factor FlgM [Lachnospiraceae bacterium]